MAYLLDVIVGGILAGVVATVILTVLMMILNDDEIMPTQILASKFVNDEPPEENEMLGLGLHFGYGIIAGIVFVGLADIGGFEEAILGSVLFGLLFGFLLFLVAFGVLGVVGRISELRSEPPEAVRRQLGIHLGMWLAWGLVAGVVGALGAGLV
jgi:hypothetical protein